MINKITDKIRGWFNEPSWEQSFSQQINEAMAHIQKEKAEIRETANIKFKEIDNMPIKHLLRFIAKELYKINVREETGVIIR